MIASKYWDLTFTKTSSEAKLKNKSLEGLVDFRNEDIEHAFVDVDEQLKQLAAEEEVKDLQQIRRHYISNIRKQLYELGSICVHGLNVGKFASHEPDDKTPLNSECC